MSTQTNVIKVDIEKLETREKLNLRHACNGCVCSAGARGVLVVGNPKMAEGGSGRVVVGVLGGGQLGRMLAEAAHNSRELTVLPL